MIWNILAGALAVWVLALVLMLMVLMTVVLIGCFRAWRVLELARRAHVDGADR